MLGLGLPGLRLSRGSAAVEWHYLVTTDAELATAISSATNGQIIALADAGTFSSQVNLSGKTGITLRGQTTGVPVVSAGINAATTTNCKITGLDIRRTAPNSTSAYNASGVIDCSTSCTGLEVSYCTISSNALSGITMQDGSSGSLFFQGYRGISGSGMTSPNIHHNTFHDCYRGVSIQLAAGTTGYVRNNTFTDMYQNPCESAGLAGATLWIEHNDAIGIWANATTDSGSPHSSVMGFSATAAWTVYLIGNKLLASPSRRFAAKGTYGTGSGPKFNDSTSNAMNYTAYSYWNIIAVEDSLGFEPSFGEMHVAYNTIVKETGSGTTTAPALNFHDIGAGSQCAKNINLTQLMGTFSSTIGGPNGVHNDWIANSWDNVIMRPNGLGTTVTGDLNCYDQHFTGPSFTGLTLANVVGIFTPLAGSYLTSEGIGAIGTGYDWTTRSYSALPTLTKPKTTNTSGTTPALTQFDGTNDWLQMNVTAPFADIPSSSVLTMAFYATYDGSDATDCYYAESSSTDFTIRKLGSATLPFIRFRGKNASNVAIFEIDSSFRQFAADGASADKRLWLFTVNLTTGRYFIMRGKEIDPFPTVTTLKAGSTSAARTQHAIMGQSDVSPPTGTGVLNGRLGLFYITDEFVNLGLAANHNSIVATDGTPADWGSSGSSLTGTQPRGFVKGDAATVGSGSGINLGSSSKKWVLTGAITDA